MNFDHPTGTDDVVRAAADFLDQYAADELGALASAYPDTTELTIDWSDLLRFDADLADDYLDHPDKVGRWFTTAIEHASVPNVELTDVTVRVVGLNDADLYHPLELVKERVRDRSDKATQEDAELAAFETLIETHAEKLQQFGE